MSETLKESESSEFACTEDTTFNETAISIKRVFQLVSLDSYQTEFTFTKHFSMMEERFIQPLKNRIENAFLETLIQSSLNFTNYAFASVYVVFVLSLQSTQDFLENNSKTFNDEAIHFSYILQLCCYFLNPLYWKSVKALSSSFNKDLLNAKRKIFKKFLSKKIKGNCLVLLCEHNLS